MIRKLLAILAFVFASNAFATDVNTASAADLDAIKGIGPGLSARIIEARTQGGAFKDWNDLITRVKGMGNKNAVRFSTAGLTVGGTPFAGAPAAPAKSGATPAKPTAPATPAASAPPVKR